MDAAPAVLSLVFGAPDPRLVETAHHRGIRVIGTATTVAEAVELEEAGVDAVVASGAEAGGHRISFLEPADRSLIGTFALVPQVVDAVRVPVIAAGGIADGRTIAAALALGAAGVQVGTAYLFTPEAKIPPAHQAALDEARDDNTMLTDLFTGRPARAVVNRLMREVGPLGDSVPAFPGAGGALAPLREAGKNRDFTNAWSGQSARLAPRGLSSQQLTARLADEALARL